MVRLVLAPLLCCAILLGACASPASVRETGPIRIGIYADLSSTASLDGAAALQGAQARVANTNAGRGIGGRIVELLPLDTRPSAAEAVKSFSSLAQEEGVCAVIGAALTNVGIAVSPVAELMKVPFVSLGIDDRTTTPGLRMGAADNPGAVRRFSFMVRPSASRIASAFASWAAERFAFRRYATVSDPADPLSSIQAGSFESAIRTAGNVIVASVEMPADGTDFGSVIDAMARAGVEAIFLCGSAVQNAAAAQAIHDSALPVALLGNQSWDADFVGRAGGALSGAWFATGMSSDDPLLADLSARMNDVSGAPARPLAAAGWDAVGLILAAVRKAGSSVPSRVRDALEQTAGFRALAGTVDMDRKTHRMSPLPVAIMRFTGGLAATVDTHYLPRAASRAP